MQPGAMIGPYRVVRPLGQGGMGAVFEVSHPASAAPLALKVILGRAAKPEAILRFEREARLLLRLRCPGIVRAHEAGTTPTGDRYLVTELVAGRDLEELLREAPPTPREAGRIARDLADAVAALHAEGIVHRDLKPANVMLRSDGSPVLLDFGVAVAEEEGRLTQTGAFLGTVAYMAPEQADDARSADERADVYGLGAVLFALLARRPPFGGSGLSGLKQVLHDEPRWPSADRGASPAVRALEQVCRVAMAKDPHRRHQSAQAFREDLDRALAALAVRAPAPRGAARGVALGAGGVGLLAALGLWAAARPGPAPEAGDRPPADAAAPDGPALPTAPAPDPPREPGSSATPPTEAPPVDVEAQLAALPYVTHPDLPARARALLELPGLRAPVERLLALADALRGEASAAADVSGLSFARVGPALLRARPPRALPRPAEDLAEAVLPSQDLVPRAGALARFLDDDGARLVRVDGTTLSLWSLTDGSPAAERTLPLSPAWHRSTVLEVHRPSGRILLGGNVAVPAERALRPGFLTLLATDPASLEPTLVVGEPKSQRLLAGALSPSGARLAIGDNRGHVTVLVADPGGARAEAHLHLPNAVIRGLTFLGEGELRVLAGDDKGRDESSLTTWALPDPQVGGEPRRTARVELPRAVPEHPGVLARDPAGHPRAFVGRWRGRHLLEAIDDAAEQASPFAQPPAGARTLRDPLDALVDPTTGLLWVASGWNEEDLDHALEGVGGAVTAWDLATGAELATVRLDDPADGAQSIDVVVTPAAVRVLVGTQRGRVLLWDLPRGP